MLLLFIVSNIVRKESNGDIVYFNLGMEFILVDIRFEFDEIDVVTVDELFEFYSDFLCLSAEISEECYFIVFFDIVVSFV